MNLTKCWATEPDTKRVYIIGYHSHKALKQTKQIAAGRSDTRGQPQWWEESTCDVSWFGRWLHRHARFVKIYHAAELQSMYFFCICVIRYQGSGYLEADSKMETCMREVYWGGRSREQYLWASRYLFKNSDLSLKIWIAPREGAMTLDEATVSLSLSPPCSLQKIFFW